MASVRPRLAQDTAKWLIAAISVAIPTVSALAQTAAATATTLEIAANGTAVTKSIGGTPVNFIATVAAGKTPVTAGTVNFCDATAPVCTDIHKLGSVLLNSTGTAQIVVIPLPGVHSYTAQFISNTADAGSTSPATSLTVSAPTTTTVTQTGSTGNYSLKATVTGRGATSSPTGTVTFVDTSAGNNALANAPLGSGIAGSTVWVTTQSPATQPLPQSITIGDFNGDGIPDIAIGTKANPGAQTPAPAYLSILRGNGDGTFQAAQNFVTTMNNSALVADHFINGGPLDILSVDSNTTGVNNANLFIGNGQGSGTVQAPFSLGGLANVTGLATADFNGDGNEDFVVTGVVYGVYCFAPLLGTGKGTFGGPTLNAIGNNPVAVAVGAFGPKGYPDIVVADSGADQVTIFQNNSQGYFFPSGQANTGATPIAIVTADFNGDGFTDAAVLNSGTKNLTILLGNGNYALTPASSSPSVGGGPTSIAVGDFNHDGIPDLAVTNSSDNTVTILIGNGDGTFNTSTPLSTGATPLALSAGNFNSTGQDTLAVANEDPAATTGSTVTVLSSAPTDTATATVNGVNPHGSGTHQVDASYPGDTNYAPSVSATISLNTTLPPYSVSVSPASLTFSAQTGTTSAAQTVTITNNGADAVTITSVTASANFAVTSACGTSLAASAICTLSVTFAPTTTGSLTGTLTIADNATGAPQTISLTGTATAPPTVSLAPTSLTFPSVVVGSSSAAQTVTLTNTGNSAATITAIMASANFSLSNNCGSSLAVGANCSISVVFTPTSSGSITGTLSVSDNATGSPQTIPLSGTATLPPPTVSVSPSSLTFATAPIGTTSAAQSVTLTNTGQSAVSISSVAVSGPFTQTNTCGTSLEVSASCAIAVIFAPTQAVTATGSLTITDNATGSPQTVALSGTGSSVSLSSSATSLTLNPSGSTATATIQISSSQGFSGSVNLTCAVTFQGTGTASNPPTCSMNPASGQVTATTPLSSTLTVTTVPAAAAQLIDQPLKLKTNDPSGNPWLGRGFALSGLLFLGCLGRRRRTGMRLALFLTFGLSLAWMATGCGGPSGPQATAGNYSVIVTATSSTVTASTTIPLIVK